MYQYFVRPPFMNYSYLLLNIRLLQTVTTNTTWWSLSPDPKGHRCCYIQKKTGPNSEVGSGFKCSRSAESWASSVDHKTKMESNVWGQRWLSFTGRSIQRAQRPSLHPGQSQFAPNYWQVPWTSILSKPCWGKDIWPVLTCTSDGCVGYLFTLFFNVPNICPHKDNKPVCSQLLSISPRYVNGKHHLP